MLNTSSMCQPSIPSHTQHLAHDMFLLVMYEIDDWMQNEM